MPPEPGCDDAAYEEPAGERELAPDDEPRVLPPELPPAGEEPLLLLLPPPVDFRDDFECVPPAHGDDEPEAPYGVMAGSGAAGAASESTNTSPSMCSTNCAGTPDGLTGCVKTMCTPVAITIVS